MSSSILEVMRVNHEQSERYEVAIGDELDERPNGQNAKVMQQHRLKAMAQKVVQYNKELVDFNLDADGILQDELQRMRSNPLDSFYHQLSSTLEYYEKFPGLQSMDQPDLRQLIDEEMEVANNKNAISFSGEEIFGKYLDLNPLFLQYVNVTKSLHSSGSGSSGNSIEQDYLQYLDKFNVFFYLPDSFKQTTSTAKPYLEYLKTLWQYLVGFYKRVHPLIEIENVIQDWEKEFEEKVKKGEIKLLKDAQKSNSNAGGVTREPQPLRLGMFNDPKELEALGLDRLKEALEALGLKCGGTLQDRAQRLWSVRGKKLEEIPASLKVKPTKKTGSAAVTTSSSTEGSRENSGNEKSLVEKVALLEFLITSLCEVMGDIVSATRRHAEKQQARSVEEKEQEIFEEEFGLANNRDKKGGLGGKDEDDEDDEPIYNPLNIPLGWDGKPIPYWLYKLHGLGVEYKCEICGNQSYWGRRAYDRHFQEWRHAHGMRCLGIPNTKHFHDITSIEHVVALYNKIKDSLQQEEYVGDLEEEFEDSHGNVLNRRTYEDLARQGLL